MVLIVFHLKELDRKKLRPCTEHYPTLHLESACAWVTTSKSPIRDLLSFRTRKIVCDILRLQLKLENVIYHVLSPLMYKSLVCIKSYKF